MSYIGLLTLAAVGVAQLSYPSAYRLSRSSGGFGRLHAKHPRPAVRVPQGATRRAAAVDPRQERQTAVAESGGERNPTVPAGRTSRRRIGAGDRSAGAAAVPARRARPRDTRMPGVGAPPHVATRADIANRYHWVAILRAGRHDYSSSARSSRATARRARRMVMAMTSREALDGALTAAQAA
jgi:hypothetical protein